jgi:thiol:disulfide interchange protein DsbD
LFFVIGLNLLGTFELAIGGAVAGGDGAQRLQSDRVSGSFWTGVLAVVVAAPCTAPFMGAAMGYAFANSAAEAIAVFVAMGVGMAAPYMVLTAVPKVLARLPRPGAWMERFKQAMAFPMFATCVWLIWVLAQQVGNDATALLLAALVATGMAAWAFGVAQRGARRFRWLSGAAAVAAASFVVWAAGAVQAPGASAVSDTAWSPWSAAEQQRALAAGRPVFVDFTAAWCVTCQFNKRTVLASDAVERAFAERKVVRLKADWTHRDDAITRELARFGRNGVPVYVIYDGRGDARLLPELLTESVVIEALRKL